jgi:cytochrome c oxidase subunit 2
MALTVPEKGWFQTKIAKDEKAWIIIALIVCLSLFVLMSGWHVVGKQNASSIVYDTSPDEFYKLSQANWKKYKIGEEEGIPVVKPPAGSDVFVLATTWRWEPILVLKKGAEYRFHISSMDLVHGFSLQPLNMNFVIHPQYDYVLTFKPTSSGDFRIICNEFCGFGHHTMIGKIIVEE